MRCSQFVFIRQPQLPAADAAAAETALKSLSVPLDHFQSSKYMIPIFTAPYLQADVYSVAQGGLPERQPGEESHPVGKLKLWFMESGGLAFRDAVDKAKAKWQQRRQDEQDENALRKWMSPIPVRSGDLSADKICFLSTFTCNTQRHTSHKHLDALRNEKQRPKPFATVCVPV